MRPVLSIVILNFNRKNDLIELITSLHKQTYKKYEIIVVDNASKDYSVEAVRERFKKVKYLALTKNIGRAGHNMGANVACGETLVFLDADIILPRGFLGKLAKKFADKSVDAASFYMEDARGRKYGWEPTYDPVTYESTFGGGMWAVRRQVFEQVGGFNPDFFIYVDEWEYMIRLWKAGYRIKYFPDLIGVHKESPYSYRSIMKGYHVIVNHAQMYALYLPVRLWHKFLAHHAGQTATIFKTGDANRLGTMRGLTVAGMYFLRALPKRNVLSGRALQKFLKFYFPQKGRVVVGKWGWK